MKTTKKEILCYVLTQAAFFIMVMACAIVIAD